MRPPLQPRAPGLVPGVPCDDAAGASFSSMEEPGLIRLHRTETVNGSARAEEVAEDWARKLFGSFSEYIRGLPMEDKRITFQPLDDRNGRRERGGPRHPSPGLRGGPT